MAKLERKKKHHEPNVVSTSAFVSPTGLSSLPTAAASLAKMYIITGAIMAGLAVVLGAFAAHGLKTILSPSELATFETGVRYQMYHGLALLCLPGLASLLSAKWANRIALCFITGCVLFSGSLYVLATTGVRWFGPITPLGGVFFIAGWTLFVVALVKGASTASHTVAPSNTPKKVKK